ncbi:MAG TPA: hypothetical protein PLP37_11720, partial [Clostridiales bacterium]|nr:hypothetical protein [Clostridiales bacterium]
MIRLLKKLTLFAFIIVLLISVLLFYLYKIGGNDLPAPAYSNSISFNEKIDFLKNKDLAKIKIAAIGSSMTLNNIDSKIIENNLGENYINLGSWGFKISDTEEYLKNMIELLPELNTVIISTTFVDFSSTTRNIEVDYDLVKKTLTYDLNLIAYALSFDLKYLFNHSKTNADKMKEKGSYDILKFDNFG